MGNISAVSMPILTQPNRFFSDDAEAARKRMVVQLIIGSSKRWRRDWIKVTLFVC